MGDFSKTTSDTRLVLLEDTIDCDGSVGDIHINCPGRFNMHFPKIIYFLEHFNGSVVYK